MATSKFSADEIDEPCRQVHFERNGRMGQDELREQGCDDQVGHVGGHRYPQAPAGLDLSILGQRSRRLDLVDDAMCVLEHAVPEIGDGELAVVRSSRRSPSCVSNAATRRETVDLGSPRRSAARLKLPSSTTRA